MDRDLHAWGTHHGGECFHSGGAGSSHGCGWRPNRTWGRHGILFRAFESGGPCRIPDWWCCGTNVGNGWIDCCDLRVGAGFDGGGAHDSGDCLVSVAVYDIVIVGAGSAGLTGAALARQLGAKVALVERE